MSSQLYVIGEGQGKGTFAVGLARDAKAELQRLQKAEDDAGKPRALKLLRCHDLERGWDSLAFTMVRRKLDRSQANGKSGWYKIDSADAIALVDQAYRATRQDPKGKRKSPAKHSFAESMRLIRTTVFGTTMEAVATIGGTAPSTVSRWESGELDPGFQEIKRLRDYAIRHGLPWKDAMLFQEPLT